MSSLQEQGKVNFTFFNNVKYLIILLVVVLHSAGSYNTVTPSWSVRDPDTSKYMDILYLLLLSFVMPVIFFVAGYFAIPSLQRRGLGSFIWSKIKRLGIPFLLGIFFIVPIITYIAIYTRNVSQDLTPLGYWNFWKSFMGDFFTFRTGLREIGGFNQAHLWFLPQLLLFFIVFGLVYSFWRKVQGYTESDDVHEPSRSWHINSVFLVFGVITWFLYFAVNNQISDVNWIMVLNILQSRPASMTLYVCYFFLGVFAFSWKWFVNDNAPQLLSIWIVACIILSVAYIIVGAKYWSATSPPLNLSLLFSFVRTFSCLTYLVVITSLAYRWWNHSSPLDKRLSDSSYTIYVIHLLIVLLFQLLLVNVGVNIVIKFVIVAFLSILTSFGISHYMIRPYPRLSVSGLVLGNIVMFLKVHPGS